MLNPPTSQTPGNITNRILVVEDEESIGEAIVFGLEEEGFEVVAVADGQAALTLCQAGVNNSQEFPFDLILLDVMLPRVNGLDLCRFLRYQGNNVPILIVSAKTTETDRVLGLEVGADDYISKPFSMRGRASNASITCNPGFTPAVVRWKKRDRKAAERS